MRSTDRLRTRAARAALVAVLVCLARLPAPSAEEKRVAIYTPQTGFTVAVYDREGQEYVNLPDVIQPLGGEVTRIDQREWKMRLGKFDAQFTVGRTRARIAGSNIELPAKFLADNGKGLVPVNGLPSVLTPWLQTPVELHMPARRVFIGGVVTTFTVEARKTAPGAVLNFTATVNPMVATEPGKIRLVFNRDPVFAAQNHVPIDDRLARAANYIEGNGGAEIDIEVSAPAIATFSNGGKTITIAPIVAAQPAPAPPVAGEITPAPPPGSPTTPNAQPARPRFIVVIDPAHGGEDSGAVLTPALIEKDIVLSIAKHLRQELNERGIAVILLRDGDVNLGFDQRAAAVNAARAQLYLSLHISELGNLIRVYTSNLPPEDFRRVTFYPWSNAQAPYVLSSRIVAQSILEEIVKHKPLSASGAAAPIQPLNSVAAAALAIEIGPQESGGWETLALASYQQVVANVIANGVVAARARIENGPIRLDKGAHP